MVSVFRYIKRVFETLSGRVRAILLILISTLAFSGMHTIIRYTSTIGDVIHPFEVAFFRNIFGLLVMTPLFWHNGVTSFKTDKLTLHIARGAIQIVAMLMFFSALSMSPLAKVSAMSFTAPLFATIGAVIFLREIIRIRRIIALIVGFLGALLILQPGLMVFDPGMLLILGSSAIWACAMLIIKILVRTDSSVTITAYQGLLLTPLSFLAAVTVWEWPSCEQLMLFAVMGCLGTAAHVSMAEAFKLADTTFILPFDFVRLVWASLFGIMIFGEMPEFWTWVGGGVICASTTYIALREIKLSGDSER